MIPGGASGLGAACGSSIRHRGEQQSSVIRMKRQASQQGASGDLQDAADVQVVCSTSVQEWVTDLVRSCVVSLPIKFRHVDAGTASAMQE